MHVLMCGYSWFPLAQANPLVHAHTPQTHEVKKAQLKKNDWTNIFSAGGRTQLFWNSIFRKNGVNDAGQMRSNPTVNYEISLNMFYESSQGWQQQDRTNFEDANQLLANNQVWKT